MSEDDRFAVDLAYEHDLSLAQGRMLAELALHALVPSHAPDSPAHLADPDVAEAYLSGPLGMYADEASIDRVERVVGDALAAGFDNAGLHFALASVAETRGDVVAQRSHLDAALERDFTFGPARLASGGLAFLAGDAGRAATLLQTVDDSRAVRMLHTLTHFPRLSSTVGRNDPCPCGSGRKAKACCPMVRRHPLTERSVWLWEKAEYWLHRMPQVAEQVELAATLLGVDADPVDPDELDVVIEALHEPGVRSVALLEGGMLQGFLDRYGSLLPDDERALAERWVGERHRIWEVEATEPGWWLRLEDLADGHVVEARNGSVSRCTRPGEVVFAAVVPDGGGDGWLLPEHPVGLHADDGDALAELVAAGIDPLAVAATVFRGTEPVPRRGGPT